MSSWPDSTTREYPTAPPKTLTSRSRTPNASPAATATSATTDCDYFSTTASPGKINNQHGSEPADPGSLRRARKVFPRSPPEQEYSGLQHRPVPELGSGHCLAAVPERPSAERGAVGPVRVFDHPVNGDE